MITTFYPPYNFGGDGIFVHRLSNELARRGHWVEVIHCVDSYRVLGGCEPTNGYENHPNVIVHGVRSRFGFLSPLATQQTGFPFFKSARIQQILHKGFDVIHYHNISLVGGPKILEYGQGIKLYTMHEYWLVCPTHLLLRFNRSVCLQPRCFLCSLTYKRPPQLWRYSRILETAIKHVDAFIAPSRFCKDLHRRKGLNVPIVHLPNFVPAAASGAQASNRPREEGETKPYFLFVGRLEKNKGLQSLIPVFRRYRSARLLVAGTGTYESYLRHLASGCGNIQFLGYVHQGDLQALYRDAIAVIVPSEAYEVFSLVVVEAFRHSTPAIVRNLGGMPELIEEGGGGIVYNNENELVAAMDRLLGDAGFRDELGHRGHEAYLRNWTPEVHVKRYLALIEEIAEARAKRATVSAACDRTQ